MGKELGSDFYNYVFSNKKYKEKYFSSYKESPWATIWIEICNIMINYNVSKIFDMGCGTGQFANCAYDHGFVDYFGVDFSQEAINQAKIISSGFNGRYDFVCQNIFNFDFEKINYDCVVATEFLEHIEKDLDILEKIYANKLIICTLPDSDSEGHVRFFPDEESISIEKIKNRYNSVANIISIKPIYYKNSKNKDYLVAMIRK